MYTRELIDTDQIVRFEAIPWNENGGPGNDRVVYLDVPADEFKLVSTDKDSRGKDFYTYDLKTNKYRDEAKQILKFGGGDHLSIKLSSQEEKDNSGKTYFSGDYDKKLYVYESDNLEEFGPDAKDEMSPSDYIQYCLEKFREYRILSMDPTNNPQAAKLYGEKAMDYYERAQAAMDEIEPDNTDHLSDEDKLSPEDQAMVDDYEEEEANREVPRDYASMYENKNKNKMNDINLNRWAKLAGINENEGNVKGNEEWEGSINGLGKEDHPQGFAEMRDIILSKYPNEGGSTYRMEVYHNNDNVATGASGGFAIENGNVYFDFKFKDGKVVDYSFDEQNY